MKIKILGRPVAPLFDKVRAMGFEMVDDHPDLIIAYGGDGTLIGAERDFPEIPKIGMRHDETCIKCDRHKDERVLERLRHDGLPEERLIKLLGTCREHSMVAMNDIIFRNADPRSAVRFFVSLNSQQVTEEIIGDGVVVATPFGSSAYFRSITRMTIRIGIGVAFNNCTELLSHMVIGEDDLLTVHLTRGPATMTCDNDPHLFPVDSGDELRIQRAPGSVRLLAADTLRCAECRYVNAPRRRY